MPEKNVLTSQRKKLCARLRQIDVLIARQERLTQPLFAHIPSFAPQPTAQYKDYIAGLNAQKHLTLNELACLIVSEFPCQYEFRIGQNFRFDDGEAGKPTAQGTLAQHRDIILNTCNLEQNYAQALRLIAARPAVEQFAIVSLAKARCLFGTGKFNSCHKFITNRLRKSKISFPEQEIFYIVLRALCQWQSGKLKSAVAECTVAWQKTESLNMAVNEQRAAILWLRAQINLERGLQSPALNDLQALAKDYKAAPLYFRCISARCWRLLDEYIVTLRQKIK